MATSIPVKPSTHQSNWGFAAISRAVTLTRPVQKLLIASVCENALVDDWFALLHHEEKHNFKLTNEDNRTVEFLSKNKLVECEQCASDGSEDRDIESKAFLPNGIIVVRAALLPSTQTDQTNQE